VYNNEKGKRIIYDNKLTHILEHIDKKTLNDVKIEDLKTMFTETTDKNSKLEKITESCNNFSRQDLKLVDKYTIFVKLLFFKVFFVDSELPILLTGMYSFKGGCPCETSLKNYEYEPDIENKLIEKNIEIVEEAFKLIDENKKYIHTQKRRIHLILFVISLVSHIKICHKKSEPKRNVSILGKEYSVPEDVYNCLDLERIELKIKPSTALILPKSLSIAISTVTSMNANCISKVIHIVLDLLKY